MPNLISQILNTISELFRGENESTRPSTYHRSRPVKKPQPKSTQTYRPSPARRKTSTISFSPTSSIDKAGTQAVVPTELKGLHDAFTGAPLNKNLGLHQCQKCKVFYHDESILVLKEANSSKCVSCHSTNIVRLIAIAGAPPFGGTDYTPKVVTLATFREHVGSVVTFEGYVHKVFESRRGNDFAVMFENKSWTKGFKLVFFRDAVTRVGGKSYINNLKGRTLKVRGLIVNHDRFGYEIIVSEKSMLISVE